MIDDTYEDLRTSKSMWRRRNTGETNENIRRKVLTWSREAFGERVAGVSVVAGANGTVVDHPALSVDAAGVRARGRALLVDARELQGTVVVHHTLGSAVRRVSHEIREAGAYCVVVHVSTFTVGSAGGRVTRVNGDHCMGVKLY